MKMHEIEICASVNGDLMLVQPSEGGAYNVIVLATEQIELVTRLILGFVDKCVSE